MIKNKVHKKKNRSLGPALGPTLSHTLSPAFAHTHAHSHKSKGKHKNTKRKSHKKMSKIGGTIGKLVNLKQIRLTNRIIDAIVRLNQELGSNNPEMTEENLKRKFKWKQDSAFGLGRMDSMMVADFDNLLKQQPIVVKYALGPTNKKIPVIIDGKMQPVFDIVNGRHRVARAIFENKDEIPIIIEGEQPVLSLTESPLLSTRKRSERDDE